MTETITRWTNTVSAPEGFKQFAVDVRRQRNPVCVECGRSFDLIDEVDAQEWFYGHDCEA